MTDMLITNGHIWTGDRERPYATAAVVRDGSFAFVGKGADVNVGSGTEVIDLQGQFIMPGFTDAHAHLMWTGFAMQSVDLKGVLSVEEAVRRVAERANATAVGSWVTGAGWDQNLWPGEGFPHRRELDAVTLEHPVQLTHTS